MSLKRSLFFVNQLIMNSLSKHRFPLLKNQKTYVALVFSILVIKYTLNQFAFSLLLFKKVEPEGKGRIYYTTKVKDHVITLTTTSFERIFHLNPNPSKFPPPMSASKARKLSLQKFAYPSKIKKTNQSYTTLYSLGSSTTSQ